jgi:hypothetical protein
MNMLMTMTIPAALKSAARAALLAALALALHTVPTAAGQTEKPIKVVFMIDANVGNLVVSDPEYAKRVAHKLANELGDLRLDFGDSFKLRAATGRSYSGRPAAWRRDETFRYPKAKPADLPSYLSTQLAKAGEISMEGDSALLWTLEELALEVDCAVAWTELFVISNGVGATSKEGEEYMLNALPGRPFEGCAKITWVGLAADSSSLPAWGTRAMDELFRKLGKSMGFADVDIIR